MTLPTSGFTTTEVNYSLNAENGLAVQISINAIDKAAIVEQFLPYLETALNDLEDAYEAGTSVVMTGYRGYEGSQTAQIIT